MGDKPLPDPYNKVRFLICSNPPDFKRKAAKNTKIWQKHIWQQKRLIKTWQKRLIKQQLSGNIKHCLIINTKWLNEMIKSQNKIIK